MVFLQNCYDNVLISRFLRVSAWEKSQVFDLISFSFLQNFDKARFCIFIFWQFRKMFDEDITNSACRFVCLVHCLFWTTGQTDGLSNSFALYVLCYAAQKYTRRGVVLKESSIWDSKTEFALALYVPCRDCDL